MKFTELNCKKQSKHISKLRFDVDICNNSRILQKINKLKIKFDCDLKAKEICLVCNTL